MRSLKPWEWPKRRVPTWAVPPLPMTPTCSRQRGSDWAPQAKGPPQAPHPNPNRALEEGSRRRQHQLQRRPPPLQHRTRHPHPHQPPTLRYPLPTSFHRVRATALRATPPSGSVGCLGVRGPPTRAITLPRPTNLSPVPALRSFRHRPLCTAHCGPRRRRRLPQAYLNQPDGFCFCAHHSRPACDVSAQRCGAPVFSHSIGNRTTS